MKKGFFLFPVLVISLLFPVKLLGDFCFETVLLQTLHSQETTPQSWKPDANILDDWLDKGVKEVRSAASSQVNYPQSLRKVSRFERLKNEVFFKLFNWISTRAISSEKIDTNMFLGQVQRTISRLKESPFRFLVSGSIFQRIDKLLNHPTIKKSGEKANLKIYSQFHQTFLNDIEVDKVIYGKEFFDEETIAQGAINTFAIKIFGLLNGKEEIYDRQAANAISLLHPIVDRGMDQGSMSKSTFGKLQDYLFNKQHPKIENNYEKIIFGYLDRFEIVFPRQFPPSLSSSGFWFSLQRLFKSQIESLTQKGGVLTPEAYYRISMDKGGLSTVLAAYTSLGPLTKRQYEFFYRSGGVFQIIDDLVDIEKDMRDGIQTIWTKAIHEKRSFEGPIRQLLNLENMIENELPNMTSDFGDPAAFKNIYQFSFKLSILRGLAKQSKYLDSKSKKLLRDRLSLSFKSIENLMSSKQLGEATPEGSDIWLLQQLVEMTNTY